MSVIICPWCQSEIMQEEHQEPDKICPICDNELDGYRTLRLDIGEPEEEDDEEEAEAADPAVESINEVIDWEDDDTETEAVSAELLQFEDNVAELLEEQELVPECPLCHEYMFEAGEQMISATQFRPRVSELLDEAIIEAPFTLTLYVCPACFTTQSILNDSHRHEVVRRLSQALTNRMEPGR
jgi:hypothetical protein